MLLYEASFDKIKPKCSVLQSPQTYNLLSILALSISNRSFFSHVFYVQSNEMEATITLLKTGSLDNAVREFSLA